MRDRYGISRSFRELSQALGAKYPVRGSSQREPYSYPDLSETESQDRSGEAHKKPCGHIGSLCRHGGDPWTHCSSAEEVVLFVPVPSVKEETCRYEEQYDEIAYEYDDLCVEHLSLLPSAPRLRPWICSI